jgi:Xaa-Pro aminopeptidase
MHLLALQRAMPQARFGLAGEVLRELRMAKDQEELDLLRAAAHAADRVVDDVAAGRLVGRSEVEVAREVRDRLVDAGHEQADFAIVGSGPNSASPHHQASDRVIEAGEPIVLDIGGTRAGYCSDTTRTLWVTGGDPAHEPGAEFRRVYALVQAAQAAGRAAVRPGVSCEDIDAAAREVIVAGGYGPQFMHRLGHGIGLETHEEPYLVAGNREPLREGYAFSIEPGIYVDGRYGARLEDIVVCGREGPIVLNETSRELRVVNG